MTYWLRPQREQDESLTVPRFETPPGKLAQMLMEGGGLVELQVAEKDA